MKKLLEVFENEKGEISFDTELKTSDLSELQTLAGRLAFNMMTRLWGGNETMVLAVIRNLAIADLSVSVNRKEMVKFLDSASEMTAELVNDTFDQMRKGGFRFQKFAPGVKPPKKTN